MSLTVGLTREATMAVGSAGSAALVSPRVPDVHPSARMVGCAETFMARTCAEAEHAAARGRT